MAETFTYSDLRAIRDVNLVACKQLFSCWRSNAPQMIEPTKQRKHNSREEEAEDLFLENGKLGNVPFLQKRIMFDGNHGVAGT